VTILNRSRTNGERLASDLQAEFLPLNEWQPNHYEILINTTPIGMHPKTDASPIPKNDLSKEMVVMDIVYNLSHHQWCFYVCVSGSATIRALDRPKSPGGCHAKLGAGGAGG
jgi:shikimate 5-dehydrogenase